jgi:uncharacterized protein YjbI with pentapeptide repeats
MAKHWPKAGLLSIFRGLPHQRDPHAGGFETMNAPTPSTPTVGSPHEPSALLAAALLASLCLLGPVSASAADCRAVPAANVDWQGCSKSKLMLSGSTLSGANLIEADLSLTDLRDSNLAGANLEKAALFRSSLAGSNAEKANFARVEGYRADFASVSASGASFVSAELQRANFSNARLDGADFQKAELGRADFSNATISNSNFAVANLARVNLNQAKFEGALDLSGAFLFLTRLEGLDLSQAKGLQQWQVDQACGDANTKLPAELKAPADWACQPDEQ